MRELGAEVRPVEDLRALVKRVNYEHELGETAGAKSLLHYRNAGLALLKCKEALDHGRWLGWLGEEIDRKRLHVSARQCRRYMALAKLDVETSNLAELWVQIQGNDGFTDEEIADVEAQLAADPNAQLTAEQLEALKAGQKRRSPAGEHRRHQPPEARAERDLAHVVSLAVRYPAAVRPVGVLSRAVEGLRAAELLPPVVAERLLAVLREAEGHG